MIRETARGDQTAKPVIDRRLLVRYRVLAFTTATLLIVLVFVGIPLQLAAGRPQVVNDVGTIHGFLYLVYLYVAFKLTRALGVPKWQMALVLLAGTVPFCAFVAERKMTRRFEVFGAGSQDSADQLPDEPLRVHAASVQRRWFSRRALLLHLEVAVLAPGCVAAGWWQAKSALAGNGLSWVYTVEWPVFALLAIAGWWYLIHEDPEAYRARKQRSPGAEQELAVEDSSTAQAAAAALTNETTVEATTARLAKTLGAIIAVELVLGIAALVLVPAGPSSGWLPTKWATVYFAHAMLGLPLAFCSMALLVRVRRSTRLARLSGWIGAVGVAIAGTGGLLTVDHPLRLAGLAFMLVGTVTAAFGYLIPTFEKLT
jgi:integral membrane protein